MPSRIDSKVKSRINLCTARCLGRYRTRIGWANSRLRTTLLAVANLEKYRSVVSHFEEHSAILPECMQAVNGFVPETPLWGFRRLCTGHHLFSILKFTRQKFTVSSIFCCNTKKRWLWSARWPQSQSIRAPPHPPGAGGAGSPPPSSRYGTRGIGFAGSPCPTGRRPGRAGPRDRLPCVRHDGTASSRGQARPGEPAPIGVRGDGSLVMVPIPYVYTINLQMNETRFV